MQNESQSTVNIANVPNSAIAEPSTSLAPPISVPNRARIYILALMGLAFLNLAVFFVSGKVLSRAWRAAHIPKVLVPATASKQEAEKPAAAQDSTPSKSSYTSKGLQVTFNYRSDWEITDDGETVTIDSPFILYDRSVFGENSQNSTQKVRGVFKILLTKGRGLVSGDTATRDSDLITHPSTFKGRKSSYLTFLGLGQNFSSMTFTAGSRFTKGAHITYDLGNEFMAPIALAAGYYDVDSPRQQLSWDDIPAANFDKTDAFEQAIEIIKSLH